MKLRRRQPPQELDPDFALTVASLWEAFEVNLDRCHRLTDLRQSGQSTSAARMEALVGAGNLAHLSRLVFRFIMLLVPLETIPEGYLPVGVYGAVARLTYALIALAEEEPEPEALLTTAELDGLVEQYQLQPWIEMWRNADADAKPDAAT
jgi:hypothetical protein